MEYSDHLKAARPCADSSVRGVYVKKSRGANPGFSNFTFLLFLTHNLISCGFPVQCIQDMVSAPGCQEKAGEK